jgi:hypothetical protein
MGMKPRQPIVADCICFEPAYENEASCPFHGIREVPEEAESKTELYERGFADGVASAVGEGEVVLSADEVEALAEWATTGLGIGTFYGALKVAQDVALAANGEVPATNPLAFSVLKFAEVMLGKLNLNAHKGGWEGDSIGSLMKRLDEELIEARSALTTFTASIAMHEDDLATLSFECSNAVDELADVANFCMMVADRAQALYKAASCFEE